MAIRVVLSFTKLLARLRQNHSPWRKCQKQKKTCNILYPTHNDKIRNKSDHRLSSWNSLHTSRFTQRLAMALAIQLCSCFAIKDPHNFLGNRVQSAKNHEINIGSNWRLLDHNKVVSKSTCISFSAQITMELLFVWNLDSDKACCPSEKYCINYSQNIPISQYTIRISGWSDCSREYLPDIHCLFSEIKYYWEQ